MHMTDRPRWTVPSRTEAVMAAPIGVKNWIRLCHDGDTDGYVVETKDGDRFVVSFEELARACSVSERGKDFRGQLRGLIERLTPWLKAHKDKVDRAYVSFNSGAIDFVIIQKSEKLDRELDNLILDLDIEIANDVDFNLIRLDVLSLPYCTEESARSFVSQAGTSMMRLN